MPSKPKWRDLAIATQSEHSPMGKAELVELLGPSGARAAAAICYRSPYETRHTYATMMLMAGVTPAYRARQLGHSVEMFLRNYSLDRRRAERCGDGQAGDAHRWPLESRVRRIAREESGEESAESKAPQRTASLGELRCVAPDLPTATVRVPPGRPPHPVNVPVFPEPARCARPEKRATW